MLHILSVLPRNFIVGTNVPCPQSIVGQCRINKGQMMECVKWRKNAALAEHCIHDGKKTLFFLSPFSNKKFIIRTEIHKILVRITN